MMFTCETVGFGRCLLFLFQDHLGVFVVVFLILPAKKELDKKTVNCENLQVFHLFFHKTFVPKS